MESRVEASRILQQRIDLTVDFHPDYAALRLQKTNNFNQIFSLLRLAISLADGLQVSGEEDAAENAYMRVLNIYRVIDQNCWYEVKGLLWKLALISWKSNQDQRGQNYAWEALQCGDVPARADRSDLDWLRHLAKSLSRTANDLSKIIQSTVGIAQPQQLNIPIPLLHRMIQSGYASSVDGNIFWTAALPGPNEPSSSEYPIVGGIATVLEFIRELPKEDLLARDHDGRSALHLAAHLRKETLGLALMIRANEIPGIKHRIMHARDYTTETILGSAIWSRCSLQFIESLIHHGVDVNPEMAILNPLHLACGFGWLDLVDLLLRHGASPEKRLPDGKTALDLAREQGHHNIVKLLDPTPQGSPRPASSHTPQ